MRSVTRSKGPGQSRLMKEVQYPCLVNFKEQDYYLHKNLLFVIVCVGPEARSLHLERSSLERIYLHTPRNTATIIKAVTA